MALDNLNPRKYQETIFNTAKDKNTLVVLPTGLGKTMIALMLAIDRLAKIKGSKVLFLAPTRPLASQHKEYFQRFLPELRQHVFTGKINQSKRMQLWQESDIIFSTPQCIANDIDNGLDLSNVSLLIEDEAHRCLKNYDYVKVAQHYSSIAKNERILGLTASPGSEASIINEICKNLNISAVEIRTRDSEDVLPYIQKLSTEIIKIDFPKELTEIKSILQEIYKSKIEELKNRQLLFGPTTKKAILELQAKIMKMIATGNKHFNVLRGASVCAQAIKLQYLLELLETQTLRSAYNYFQDLFKQAERKESKAVISLVKNANFIKAYSLVLQNLEKVEHPKIEKIKEIVRQEIDSGSSKILIFSQYRDTINIINKSLNDMGINSKLFIGQQKKNDVGMNQKEQKQVLEEFKQGKINVLVATSIGEEGLDIPEVNTVIFYEPVPSAIRKIQRAGRTARLKPGKLIILITKKTRDEGNYWAAIHKEKKMHEILKNMKDRINKKPTKKENLDDFI